MLGPFTLHEQHSSPDYELHFDWDEAFDSRGLTITQLFAEEKEGEMGGAAVSIQLTREEAQKLYRYLIGCINYRPLPESD